MSSLNPELAIIIVNYRTPQLVIDCLESFKTAITHLNALVVVVDNCSGDDSSTLLEQWLQAQATSSAYRLIKSEVNRGFASGNNIGIRAVKADYYLLLNSDTLVRADAIEVLLTFMKQQPDIGLLAPRLEWPDATAQESCFHFHTPISEFISAAKTGIFSKIFRRFIVAQPVSDVENKYDWVSFACVLIKAKVLDEVGLLDEGYFMYFEDVEFCRRAKQYGWKIAYQPLAHVVHLRGGSSPLKKQAKLRKRLPRYFYESRTRFFFQSYGWLGLMAANVLWTLGMLVTKMRSVVSPTYETNIAERQWQDSWINFSHPLRPYIHPDDYGKT